MPSIKSVLTDNLNSNQYSTVYSKVNKFNNCIQYTEAETAAVISNLSDVIPDDGYLGFYVNKLKEIGIDRFLELANKARAASDTPQKLFCWMLKNNNKVR